LRVASRYLVAGSNVAPRVQAALVAHRQQQRIRVARVLHGRRAEPHAGAIGALLRDDVRRPAVRLDKLRHLQQAAARGGGTGVAVVGRR
jgi:hypothetical protein